MKSFLTWFFQLFDFSLMDGLIILALPFLFDFFPTLIRNISITFLHIYRFIAFKYHLIKYGNKEAPIGVSVIISAHNEEERIAKTIDNILNQNYPKIDIIVIDDNSTDKTYNIAKKYAREGKIKLFRRLDRKGSKAAALNRGIELAKNNVVVTVDADTVLHENTIREITKLFYKSDVVAIAGNIRVSNDNTNILTKLQAYEYILAFDLGRRWMDAIRGIIVVPGAIGAYKRDFLRSLGKFDKNTITEDFDTALKFHKVKGRVIFAPNAYAWTAAPEKFKDWVRQRTRWARGELECLQKHKNIMLKKHFGLPGMIGAPLMVFRDIILLLIRIFYIYFVFVLFPFINKVPLEKLAWYFTRTILLTMIIYMIVDLLSILTCFLISPQKKALKYFIYFPISIFIYRPVHSIVRLRGYLEHITHKIYRW